MQTLQGSFGQLQVPLEVNHTDHQGDLLETCFQLTNLHARCVGHNQIRTVYMPAWRDNADDIEIWDGFEDIMFGDQQRKDQVSCFHILPVYDN